MEIDGKLLARAILTGLKPKIRQLNKHNLIPTLTVVQIGDNPASLSYIRQKQKAADKIGARLMLAQLKKTTSLPELKSLIEKHNQNPEIHGLVVQRPLPPEVGDTNEILNSISPQKDVDGFVPSTKFAVPVVKAVLKILQQIHPQDNFLAWLLNQKIVVIGRGETAGKPIVKHLKNLGALVTVVHSKTVNPQSLMVNADILISCVGKIRTVTAQMVKPRAILISVGLTRDMSGKLHGDYEEEEIAEIASFYTPTPGGVGPVNVACLMENLVYAATHSLTGKN